MKFKVIQSFILALWAATTVSANYFIYGVHDDVNCSQRRLSTRYLPIGCNEYMGSVTKREYNSTHMWSSNCEGSGCSWCSEPTSSAARGSCAVGTTREAGPAAPEQLPSSVATDNIAVYWKNTPSCSPTQTQVDEVRLHQGVPVCHSEPGRGYRFYMRCDTVGNIQIVNCTRSDLRNCVDQTSCSVTTLFNATSLCFDQEEYDLFLTYSCNLTHFFAGNYLPPAPTHFLSLTTATPAAPLAPLPPPTSSAPQASSPSYSPSPSFKGAPFGKAPIAVALPPASGPSSFGDSQAALAYSTQLALLIVIVGVF